MEIDEKNFEPELNEEIFDVVDAVIEEEFEKFGIPKRVKYELLFAINKNLEMKLKNTRIQINHIVGQQVNKVPTMNFDTSRNIVEQGVVSGGSKHIETSSLGSSLNKNNDTLIKR